MRTNWLRAASLFLGLAVLASGVAYAETDVAASLYGAFSGTTSAQGNLVKLFTSIDAFTNTAEPMIGMYFRF